MKQITLAGVALALAVATGNAVAAGGPTAGSFGLNIGVTRATTQMGTPADFMITGKYLMTKDTAILAGLGLNMADNGQSTNNKYTKTGFMGGIRKYLKTDDLSPFVGGRIQYMSTRDPNTVDVTDFALLAEVGAEYFLGKQFSLEGSVGGGYTSQETKNPGSATSTKATGFGTATFSLSANFYF